MTVRIPSVGDPVWWATKQDRCTVDKVDGDGMVHFHSTDQLAKRPSGRLVARWTGSSAAENFTWSDVASVWVLGTGATPKVVRGAVVMPEPIDAGVSGTQSGRIL